MAKKIDVLVPQAGDNLYLYSRLDSYISLFDISWRKRIIATDEDEIRRFEYVFNLNQLHAKIPESYYIFLRKMGENDGGLITDTLQDVVISRRQLTDDYIEELKFDSALNDSLYIPFCSCPLSGAELSFDLGSENVENIVVTYGRGELSGRTDDTLDKLLFRCAFRKYCINSYPQCTVQIPDLRLVKFRIDEASKFNKTFPNLKRYHSFINYIEREFGIEETWFSNKDGYLNDYYVGVCDSCILTMRHTYNTLFGTVSGNNSSLINKIIERLSDILDIEYGALSPNTIF